MKRLPNVTKIVKDVKENKGPALEKYCLEFDKEKPRKITLEEIETSFKEVDSEFLINIKKAKERVEQFAKAQYKTIKSLEITNEEVTLGQKIIPIEKVGCYVPGGRYPLPSTALMTCIPAKIAGAKEIVVCSPKIKPEVIVAASLSGATQIYSMGGPQAIAALAYGTNKVNKVDMIVGPGNSFVNSAKKEVYGDVGIDFIAGPSELLVFSDKTGNPEIIASDLISQAEHDIEARCYLVTLSYDLAKRTKEEIKKQLVNLETKEIAEISLEELKIIKVDSVEEGIIEIDKIAPEHLELQLDEKLIDQVLNKIKNYGAAFLGEKSAEVFGDYCSGPNHTLPTMGVARYRGGLSVLDFIKIVTYQKVHKGNELIKIASSLAKVEGLMGHRESALKRA